MNRQRLYAVAGIPVHHSKSPDMFRQVIDAHNAVYTRISTDNAETLHKMIHGLGLSGLNITTPLKESMLRFIDKPSGEVERIQGVNTIISRQGQLFGYNTDPDGVVGALKASGAQLSGRLALVIGSGGAGRAAVVGLMDQGASVCLTNRSGKNLSMHADRLGCRYIKPAEFLNQIKEADIIVNTAEADLATEFLPLLKSGQYLLNADYKNRIPLQSEAVVVDGLAWLLHQGIAAYRIFFDESPDPDAFQMEQDLKSATEKDLDRISLVGFMGAGKSELARQLAGLSGRRWIDTDQCVERDSGRFITRIFKEDGEERFRTLESLALKNALKEDNTVVSIGGGAVIQPGNRQLLIDRSFNLWIWSDMELISERIKQSPRPLIQQPSDIADRMKDRIRFYNEVADLIVPNNGSIEACVKHIKKELLWE